MWAESAEVLELSEEKKQENIVTKEDLQKSQLQTLATFEMLRKERKEEKKKQKQIRLGVESTPQSKDKQLKPLPSLRKTNDLDPTSNSSS